jgi:hypothetical protein
LTRLFSILKRILADTAGGVAVSSLVVCTISGIVLAIPFQVNASFESISRMLIDNPAAVYFRNIHFWSAQFFLVFTLLHMIDHFIQATEYNISRGVWTRLILSLPVLFFVMISGFILKGDADGLSAFRILSSLVEKIPFAGDLLQASFLGKEDNLELVYVHHIATSSIILFIILFEHTQKAWPSATGFIILLFIFFLTSFFLHPPFGTETGRGPWYFIGYQEILHWFSRPGLTWFISLILLMLIWTLPRVRAAINRKFKIILLLFLGFYCIITVTASFFRGDNWEWKWPWYGEISPGNEISVHPLTLSVPEHEGFVGAIPLINGNREACMICHAGIRGLGVSHDPSILGCYSCHGGNPFTMDKAKAHKRMRLIPGNLSDAQASCGTSSCHPGIPQRISGSIMSTMSGVVSVDRFVFGESNALSAPAHIKDIGWSAADQHLRDLCANCHLGHLKTEWGPFTEISRGGGCNACHLNYSDSALSDLPRVKDMGNSGVFYHPQISLEISDGHCFGCHSRSGRIATSYEGWHETLYEKDSIPSVGRYRVLEDQRVFEYIGEDVHYKLGMSCIDCHSSMEVMGDGKLYAHKEEQVKITCKDCHFKDQPLTVIYNDLDVESKKIIRQRQWHVEGFRLLTVKESGLPVINAWIDSSDKAVMRTKLKDTLFALKPPLPVCTQGKAHSRLSCESCHTSWVPQCIGCHNSFEHERKGFDLLDYREKTGSWVEYVGVFKAEKPTLGIVEDHAGYSQVKTFTPGMIIKIDKPSFSKVYDQHDIIFHRLYAPIAAHTISREGRSCKSCHLDPLAIGYGRGELVYDISSGKGKWSFRNRFALNEHDHLPEDAWIGFLTENTGVFSTREIARPFNLKEQEAILAVGACLTCHEESSRLMQESLQDFEAVLQKVSRKCVLPDWD